MIASTGSFNTFKRRQADKLVRVILSYWQSKGYTVRVWVSTSDEIYHDGRLCCVKSNLINGCPPGAKGDEDNIFYPGGGR